MYGFVTENIVQQKPITRKKLLSPNQIIYKDLYQKKVDLEIKKILNFQPQDYLNKHQQTTINVVQKPVEQKPQQQDKRPQFKPQPSLVQNKDVPKKQEIIKPAEKLPIKNKMLYPFMLIILEDVDYNFKPNKQVNSNSREIISPFVTIITDQIDYSKITKSQQPLPTNSIPTPFEYQINEHNKVEQQQINANKSIYPFSCNIEDIIVYEKVKEQRPKSIFDSQIDEQIVYKNKQITNSKYIQPFEEEITSFTVYKKQQKSAINGVNYNQLIQEVNKLKQQQSTIESQLTQAQAAKKKMKIQQLTIQLKNIKGLISAKQALVDQIQKQ